MIARIIIISVLMFVFSSFVNAKTNIQQILMSHPWYEEVPPGMKKLYRSYDGITKTGFDFGKDSVRMYAFNPGDPEGKGLSFTYPYYLCDRLPDYGAYDKGKVGKTTSGKYLIILEIRTDGSVHPLRCELVSVDNQCIKITDHDLKITINRTWRPRQ